MFALSSLHCSSDGLRLLLVDVHLALSALLDLHSTALEVWLFTNGVLSKCAISGGEYVETSALCCIPIQIL